ncbi:MAG: efflux transporter outer membrane subunit [Cyclobacteriaceae bacterium]|nr:efflux transporter outer membrane subunit [Cyclobacteriaceae bacterium]
MKSINALSLVLVAVLLVQCKVAPPVQTPEAASLPSSFPSPGDSTQNSAQVPWREFFDDPFLVKHIEMGIANNLDLKMAVQRIEMAQASVRVAKGAFFPTLSATAAVGQRKFGEYTMDGIGNFDTNFSTNLPPEKRVPEHLPDYWLGVQSVWEIDLWGKLRNQKKSAVARFLATEKARHLVVTSLVAEIARSYYELLALDNELVFIQENIQLQQTAVELINAQKAAGRATELAVKQVTAQLLNTQSRESLAKQMIVYHENQINLLLGRFPQPVERGRPILDQPLPREIHAGIPAQMLTRRPDIAMAELRLEAARFDVKATRAAFFPSLAITSSLGLQSFRPEKFFNTPGSMAYSVFGGLTAPVFQRNMLKADYQRASAAQMELFYEYQKLVINGFQETVTGLKRIENFQTASTLKAQEVTTLQEAVSTANDLYIAGLASYLEVILAQKNVLEAELQLAETRKEQFFSVIDLYRALGGGW